MKRSIMLLLVPITMTLILGVFGEYYGLRFPINNIEIAVHYPFGQKANFLGIAARLDEETAISTVLFISNLTLISVILAICVGVISVLYVRREIEVGEISNLFQVLFLSFVFSFLAVCLFLITSNLNYSSLFSSLTQDFRYLGSIVSMCVLLNVLLSIICQFAAATISILVGKLITRRKGY